MSGEPAERGHHGHDHGTSMARAGEAAKRPLTIALSITAATLALQVVFGLTTGSLSLLTDAAHLLTDVGGIVLALAAVTLASRPTRDDRTFGLYRLEVLSALANAALLTLVALWAVIEAVERIQEPPDVPGWPVLVVGFVGLIANLVAFRILSGGTSLAAEGARLEVLADAVGSVGVVLGGLLIIITDNPAFDAWIGLAIGVWIVPRALRLGKESLGILMQSAPKGLDVDEVRSDLMELKDVVDVHDLHIWTLTTDMDVLTAHVVTTDGADLHSVLDRSRDTLATKHSIKHATLQVEPESHIGCDQVDW